MEAIKIFLAFATYMNFTVFQMDVKSAFLNGKLKEEVYVKLPPSFESSKFPAYVCKLDKALYGLKQAPKAWYETLSTFLIQNKFAMERINNLLFIYKSKGDVLLVQVYVDDIIFGSTSYKLYKQFEKLMTNKFEMSVMGELIYFLRLQIKQDGKGISICQEQYTRNLLKKYEISYYSLVKTMVSPNNLGPDLTGKPVSETSYRGMIGSLMYLTATRPDIQFSTVLCARHQSNPKESYLIIVKRIIRYLKVTLNLGLYYPKCPGFDLKRYSDSNYDGCNMDRYNTSGACQILGRKLMKGQFSDYDIHYKMAAIFCDHTSAVAISNNPVLHSSTKHIDIRYHFIRDHILKGKNVAHLSPETVKKELAKIITNPEELLSCGLENSVYFYDSEELLGPEYTQDEKFGNLPGILSNSNFSKDPSKVTDIELMGHMVAINNQKESVSLLPFSKKKKVKSQTMTLTLPKSQGPETSGALSKKRKQPKPKKIPSEAKVTPTLKPMKDSEQSQSVSSGTVPNPQYPERNIQLTGMGLPFISPGTTKTTTRPKGPLRDKDSKGNKPPVDMEPINPTIAALSGTGIEYQPDTKTLPLTTIAYIQAYLLSDDVLLQESDEEVFMARDDMDADPKADEEV
ncbi:retrovirus-related pol polyprotein from transposon TNT 1-94 [Tanacetum coccineum]